MPKAELVTIALDVHQWHRIRELLLDRHDELKAVTNMFAPNEPEYKNFRHGAAVALNAYRWIASGMAHIYRRK